MLMVSDPSGGVKPLKKEKTDMAKNILILSASLRAGSNSETLANAFADGARADGHTVEIVSLRGKQIAFCRGCLACQTLGKCVIDDDAVAITEKMQHADVIAFATPIYYYEMSGQLKTMLDRANSLFPSDYAFRDIYLLAYADEIRSAVLVIHGDQAHSCYFSRDAFAKLQGDNKELLLIPGAVHTDLYDRMDIIPFDRIEAFYRQYLK